jgi:DNA-binding MarR family transcriptional regulator
VTGWLVNGWLDSQRARVVARPTAPKPEVQILVAKKTAGAGIILQPSALEWRAWPKEGLNATYVVKGKDAANSMEGFIGAVVRRGLGAGEPVTIDRVVKPGERGFLAAVLTPGMRAVSVPVNAAAGVSGLVERGYYLGSNASYNIKQLSDAGLIEQERSPHDKRSVRVKLTKKGKQLCDNVAEAENSHARAMLNDGASAEEIETTLRALRRLETTWSEFLRYDSF